MALPDGFERLVAAVSREPGVTLEKGWGSSNTVLKCRGKIFVLLRGNEVVFKLPQHRVDELIASDGKRFDPRRNGKLMKEWVVLPRGFRGAPTLAREAHRFVSGTIPSKASTRDRKRPTARGVYRKAMSVRAPAERVFDALATLEGLRGWWTTRVSGSPNAGGDLRFEFAGLEEHVDMHVERSEGPSIVEWSCLVHTELPEWGGTRLTFEVKRKSPVSSKLDFHHHGLVPGLECYDHCAAGWEHFLKSLVRFVELGNGTPFGAP